jgi:hypothetical protein
LAIPAISSTKWENISAATQNKTCCTGNHGRNFFEVYLVYKLWY